MTNAFYMIWTRVLKLPSLLNYVKPSRLYKFSYENPKNLTSKKFRFVPMSRPRLLLLSSSVVHGHGFLEYAASDINTFLNKNRVSTVLFVPYAAVDHDAYLAKVRPVFTKWGYQVEGIHQDNPVDAVKRAEAIFVGGGNTFLLLKTLYDKNLVKLIRERVFEDGVPYIGSSAGTNIAAPSIHNTNDMPIVYPPSFNALNLIPFNINPHYLDTDPNSTHKGETREERILQYHSLPDAYDVYNVLGLREGSLLLVDGEMGVLKGIKNARLFIKGKPPQEIEVGTDLSHLFANQLKASAVRL
ncbi:alpha-aspartyl dipeptidase isoform X2 [Tribolium castaneum]|uniref:alpha-aspartyl dipeptidase isoform X2 n=1 Tax=Tribolium castaneum TaxID=7070 RepID=UPI00046C2DA8|nr:PREDICTED: alpha-aspartyl dipeptidase isoform X2 [Tribolium castaneum]|eukprot:XP_008193047.1 PREDICTED: alpha-aspartyl dipeptidase isoform X2 [Tribolium castaneum]